MKRRLFALLMCAVLAAASIPAAVSAEQKNSPDYGTPGVDYAEGVVIACVDGGIEALNQSGRLQSADTRMEEVMDVSSGTGLLNAADGAESEEKSLVAVSGSSTSDLMAELSDNPAVEFVEPDYLMKLDSVEEPSDPGYKYQWGVKNQEDSSAANTDMDVEAAWNLTGSNVPVVAVLDSGVDYTNPDLSGVMWEDGEKYPSLTALGGGKYGYYPAAGEGESAADPMDTIIGHGTHCAGIIAAEWNNGTGGAGVVPTDIGCRIMALRMFNSAGGGDVLAALKAYEYMAEAKKCGIDIVAVNNSWGPAKYNGSSPRALSTAIEKVGELGIISFFAAGNASADTDRNPASVPAGPYVVNVGAMDSQGNPASFSCYGQRTVDVFAPGVQILSTTSTYGTAEKPNSSIEMPMKYLPELGEDLKAGSGRTNESYYYENFESLTPSFSMKLCDKDGKTVDSAVSSAAEGFAGKGIQIPLSSIATGDEYNIEMSFPADWAASADADGTMYFACKGSMGMAGAESDASDHFQVKGSDGEWSDLLSTEMRDGKNLSARFFPDDSNWNTVSCMLLNPSALLNSTDGSGHIVIRMNAKKVAGEDIFRMDDFGIGKTPSAYYYADGTSMATPMVTGAAVLLSTKYTDASEIIARLKGSVNTSTSEKTGMADKCVTGGYVDAARAFGSEEEMNPVVNSITVNASTKTAVIKGYFFGSTRTSGSSVTIGGKTASVTQWGDREITVSVPDQVSGTVEVRVTKSSHTGHNFLDIDPTCKGYADLAVPALTHEVNGAQIKSDSGTAVAAAAAGNSFCYLAFDPVTNGTYMEAYDIGKNEWRNISLPSDLPAMNSAYLPIYALAGGKEKIYLKYPALKDAGAIVKLGTLDLKTDTWQTVQTSLIGAESLVVYHDQLLAIGGENGKAFASVKTVDPTTGIARQSDVPDMPEARSNPSVCASGDTIAVAGGYDSVAAKNNTYTNTMIYDGKKWTDNKDSFFDTTDQNTEYGLDKMQTLEMAFGCTNGGMIVTGPVRNLQNDTGSSASGGTMTDTWHLNGSEWAGDQNVLFSSRKTYNDVGAVLNGKFYVLGFQDGLERNMVFRSVDVDSTDPTGDPTHVTGGPAVRLGGQGRYDTAAQIVRQAFPNGSDTVILASGANWPDALAASALAGVKGCPILLTEPERLTEQTADLISELKTKNVIIAGGAGSVSDDVRNQLIAAGIADTAITRLYGDTRTETADRIAEAVMESGSLNKCFICTGRDFPDALSVAAYANMAKAPILLTDSEGRLSDETLKIAGQFKEADIIGGEGAVGKAVEDQLASMQVQRYGGATRYETNGIILASLYSNDPPAVAVATGLDFPDTLTAAPLCGNAMGAILLLDGSDGTLTDAQKSFFHSNGSVWILGGTGVESSALESAINEAMK
jgi:putative cell wall-binding protein